MQGFTNNPRKLVGLEGYGLEVAERVGIEVPGGRNKTTQLAARRPRRSKGRKA